MQKNHKNIIQILIICLVVLGITCIVASSFYDSSYLAILGVSFVFWGGILLYIKPTRNVPLRFLTAVATSNACNTERLLTQHKISQKAIYLPPKNLQDPESSLMFISKMQNQPFPQPQDTKVGEISLSQDSLFLTPPGSGLVKLFEEKLGGSFTKVEIRNLQNTFSKLLVEDLSIAENVEIQTQGNAIIVEVYGSIFTEDCQETQMYPLTHKIIGCLFSSFLACVLAKTTGKPIIIDGEEHKDVKTAKIQFLMLEE
ncbi:MAG: hypothetical protein NWF01_08125 [Candidatus Bathyarchaeota archaeon]|nr:hypothetical protein [Candidatus Bathyarchaeota archaeon]